MKHQLVKIPMSLQRGPLEEPQQFTFEFPDSEIQRVHQTGTVLETGTGLEVIIRYGSGKAYPNSAEVINDSDDLYADIGLGWHEGELVDYDGVFSLLNEVVLALRVLGHNVPKDMES